MIDNHQESPKNLPAAFFSVARRYPNRAFLHCKRDDVWRGLSYAEVAALVRRCARGLNEQGVKPGDRVMIIAENSPEWVIADLAIMTLGAIVVPGYSTSTAADLRHIMDDCGAMIAITSGGELADTVLEVARLCDTCRCVIMIDDSAMPLSDDRLSIRSWQKMLAGDHANTSADTRPNMEPEASAPASSENPIDENKIAPDDLACLIYTSGTGGNPKGVMLTHRSLLSNVNAAHEVLTAISNIGDHERFLSLLPLSHAYEHTAGLHLPIAMASEIWFCKSIDQVASNLIEVKPTLMLAVPRLYELLYDRILRSVEIQGGLKEKMMDATISLGQRRLDGERLSFFDRVLNKVLDRLVRAKIRSKFGGRLKYFISGGAALNPEVGRFFLSAGIFILQGYGQTEASPVVSVNPPHDIRIETVGLALPGVEVRLDDDGQILIRGEAVMRGYWNNPKSTNKTIVDGWLHTGDIGVLDDDGYISITGRVRDIIINSGGDNIAPDRVEGMLLIQPEIRQAMIYGDKKPWLVAVVTVAEEVLNMGGVKGMVKRAIERANKNLAQHERVRRFVLTDEPFSIDNKQLTPTLKTRRHIVSEVYGVRLEKLYPKK